MTALETTLLKLKMAEATPELEQALNEAAHSIRVFCNMDEGDAIPNLLTDPWASMAVGLYQHLMGIESSKPQGALTSVTMGDTSYGFASAKKSAEEYLADVVHDYAAQLIKFRRLRW